MPRLALDFGYLEWMSTGQKLDAWAQDGSNQGLVTKVFGQVLPLVVGLAWVSGYWQSTDELDWLWPFRFTAVAHYDLIFAFVARNYSIRLDSSDC